MPIISVLIPCYNAETNIEQALESLDNQSLSDFEIIAVDDGSSDSTPCILKQWQSHDDRIRIITQSHQGIVSALNRGLRECHAPYVARMDTDDLCHTERLAQQVAYLDNNPGVGVIGCQVVGFPAHQVRKGFQIYIEWLNSLLSHEDICREIFIESPLPHPSVAFRRELVLEAGGYHDHGWAEDYDLWLRLYLANARFSKIPRVLLEWREHAGRLTRTDSRYSLENFIRAKAHYLMLGPLAHRDGVMIWGAGMIGRRLSKHLARKKAPLDCFIDVDPRKIGRTQRGLTIIAPEQLPSRWSTYKRPVILSAVGARGARELIRQHLQELGLREGLDWWGVA